MTAETEGDRLSFIDANDWGEYFQTGRPEQLLGVLDREYLEVEAGYQRAQTRRTVLRCRTSDVAAHELVKDSKLVRVADSATFFVQRIEDDGRGMAIVVLKL